MTITEHLGEKAEYYKNLFESWEATELHINENHDIWRLQSPKYESEFIAMYRDKYRLFIYGDYGNLIFDRMTWEGNPHNLQYDKLDYQMEKLSHDCRESIEVYDENDCVDDILEWFKEKVKDYQISDELYEVHISDFLKDTSDNDVEWFIRETIEDYRNKVDEDELEEISNDLWDIERLLTFTKDATEHVDQYEWIAWLRQSNLDDFEDSYDSKLWNAGKRIHQRFYVNLYAMQILSKKLKEQATKPENIIKDYFASGSWLNANFEDFTGRPISAEILENGIMPYIENTIAQMPDEELTAFAARFSKSNNKPEITVLQYETGYEDGGILESGSARRCVLKTKDFNEALSAFTDKKLDYLVRLVRVNDTKNLIYQHYDKIKGDFQNE